MNDLCHARFRSVNCGHCWKQLGVSPELVGAGSSVDGVVPLGEAEFACEAVFAKLATERGLCASVTDNVVGFDGLVRVVACLIRLGAGLGLGQVGRGEG